MAIWNLAHNFNSTGTLNLHPINRDLQARWTSTHGFVSLRALYEFGKQNARNRRVRAL